MVQSADPVVPRTAEQLADLEASYRPFHSAREWRACHVDEPRWVRYLTVLERRVGAAGEAAWHEARDMLLRAAALDSAALDGLVPANPEMTAMVLASSIGWPQASAADDAVELVAECHRRALILASEAAA